MKTAKTTTRAGRADGQLRPKSAAPRRPDRYHHGSLREALLQAAERILEQDGINGLTLRAAAREAGVSHAAPKNHFGDIAGLLSELAAVGFERFAATMRMGVRDEDPPDRRLAAIGRGYVAFARAHPDLFLLMFRSERLDMSRPALRAAADASARMLSDAVGARRSEAVETALTLPQAAEIVVAWSLVHGFVMLLLDGRLKPLLARLPPGTDTDALLAAVFGAVRRRG
ncbi:MAG: TetR/AcrR family transcriptional regulator [Alphaproteobacteria bacterium]|nr:TetR/AcrR family transcriptional regulator [Alphaproteobacteria bacterium]